MFLEIESCWDDVLVCSKIGVAISGVSSGGLYVLLPQKDIEKKKNLMEQCQGAKKINCTNLILILWEKCMAIAFELQQG